MNNSKKAVTLMQVIISVFIIMILGSIAIPTYISVVERGKLARARESMATIAEAEHMYALEHDYAFIACSTTANTLVPILGGYIEMNDIQNSDWNFVVTVGAGIFTITASEQAGRNTAEVVTFNQAGGWGGNFTP